jgi:hypothetical protein
VHPGLFPSRTLVGAGAIACARRSRSILPAPSPSRRRYSSRSTDALDGGRIAQMATAGEGPGEKVFSGPAWPQDCPERRSRFSRSYPAAPPAQQQLRQIPRPLEKPPKTVVAHSRRPNPVERLPVQAAIRARHSARKRTDQDPRQLPAEAGGLSGSSPKGRSPVTRHRIADQIAKATFYDTPKRQGSFTFPVGASSQASRRPAASRPAP